MDADNRLRLPAVSLGPKVCSYRTHILMCLHNSNLLALMLQPSMVPLHHGDQTAWSLIWAKRDVLIWRTEQCVSSLVAAVPTRALRSAWLNPYWSPKQRTLKPVSIASGWAEWQPGLAS